jgi:hypothetical protein
MASERSGELLGKPTPGSVERVRFVCPSCSKTMLIPVADHARLVQSGMAFPCPACKSKIQVSQDGQPVTKPNNDAKKEASGASKILAPVSGTDANAAKDPLSAISVGANTVPSPVKAATPDSNFRSFLAGLASFVLFGIGAAYWAFSPDEAAQLQALNSSAAAEEETSEETDSASELPQATESAPAPVPTANVGTPADSPEALASLSPSRGLPKTAPVEESKEATEPEPEPPAMEKEDAEEKPVAPSAPAGPPKAVTPRVRKEGKPLAKVLATPKLYANMGVELNGVYCIARTMGRGPDGGAILPIVRSEYHVDKLGKYGIDRKESANLEVEPALAKRLLDAKIVTATNDLPAAGDWQDYPAIVTVYAAGKGEGWSMRIMKLVFLTDLDARSEASGGSRKLHVEFNVVEVTSEAAQKKNLGEDPIWAHTSQLGPVVVYLRRIVEAAEKVSNQNERPALRKAAVKTVGTAKNFWSGDVKGPTFDLRMRKRLQGM